MPKKKLAKAGDIVEVVWHDAAGKSDGWVDIDDVVENIGVIEVNSAGYVLDHTEKQLIICHSVSADEQVIAPLAIPSGWIQSLRILK